MRLAIIIAVLITFAPLDAAFAQLSNTGNFHIVWEVKNRFRLFRNEADFLRQVAASRGDGVLAAEDRLERDSVGLGWAKDVVDKLCIDASGDLLRTCQRDGEKEDYLEPHDHPIGVAISGDVFPRADQVRHSNSRSFSATWRDHTSLRAPFPRRAPMIAARISKSTGLVT